ncbi:hypothetical protein [Compostibacter hankyongensis]|uniref:Uncharacterized protein n=1 Tax=Compostibacter hankyongensis TaxID=1007089 RepID=A0ABP8FL03_9BACT
MAKHQEEEPIYHLRDILIRGLSDSRLRMCMVKSTLGENAILLGATGLTEGSSTAKAPGD